LTGNRTKNIILANTASTTATDTSTADSADEA
jgi:hypothetical protein